MDVIFRNSTRDSSLEHLKLILMNTNYGNGSVIDILKKVRVNNQARHTPIVILSSSTLHDGVRDAYLTGSKQLHHFFLSEEGFWEVGC
jgi:hypothetical protein